METAHDSHGKGDWLVAPNDAIEHISGRDAIWYERGHNALYPYQTNETDLWIGSYK